MMFAKQAKWKLYQKWLAQKLVTELPKYTAKQWDRFDANDLLNPIGLRTNRPVSTGLGGVGIFILGAVAGSIVGLLLAPKTGTELRLQVKDKAMGYLQTAKTDLPEHTASA